MPLKPVNIRLDDELWKSVKASAARSGETITEFVTHALTLRMTSEPEQVYLDIPAGLPAPQYRPPISHLEPPDVEPWSE